MPQAQQREATAQTPTPTRRAWAEPSPEPQHTGDQAPVPGCRCRRCHPGLTGIPPAAGQHSIDRDDLELLMRLGLADVARQIAAGRCEHCGYSRASLTHRLACEQPRNPTRAPAPIAQPWEPKPSRRLARAA